MITEYAFPCSGTEGVNPESLGMSLRDYFAAKASEEDVEAHQSPWTHKPAEPGRAFGTRIPDCDRETAKFRYADAMLKARNTL